MMCKDTEKLTCLDLEWRMPRAWNMTSVIRIHDSATQSEKSTLVRAMSQRGRRMSTIYPPSQPTQSPRRLLDSLRSPASISATMAQL